MSVFRKQGLLIKPGGLTYFIGQQLKLIDLRPVTSVHYKFDPFRPDIRDFRKLLHGLSNPKIRDTNYKCTFKTEIVSDYSEPEILCKLENGSKILFKAGNLSALEILEEFNKLVLPLCPPPEVVVEHIRKKKPLVPKRPKKKRPKALAG